MRELWEEFEAEVPEPPGFTHETWEDQWPDTRRQIEAGGLFLAEDGEGPVGMAKLGTIIATNPSVQVRSLGSTVSVSADHASATFMLSGPEGAAETITVNGREITLQANTKATVDLTQA